MALVNRSFQLDVTPGAIPQVVKVSEYDENREYTVTLIDEGGVYEIPSGTTAKVEGSIGGNAFSESATVSGNTITFTLTESMTALAGDVWCKIKLTKDSKPIQTAAFILRCDRAGVEAGTVIGAPGFEEQIADAVDAWLDEHGGITVDDTLSQQGEAADAKAVGDKVKNIGKITEWFLGSEETSADVTSTLTINDGGRISPVNGSVASSSMKNTDFVELRGYEYVTYGRIGYASGTGEINDYGMAFYDSSKSFISGQKAIRGVTETGYQQTTLAIPSGAVYARFTLEVSANFPQTDFKVVLSGQQTPEGEIPSPPDGVTIPQMVTDIANKVDIPSGGTEGQAIVKDGSGNLVFGDAGISDAVKTAILACFRNVAWTTENGNNYYKQLAAALYPDSGDGAVNLTGSLVIISDSRINPSTGGTATSSLKCTDFVDLTGYKYISYGRIGYSSGSGEINDYGMAFYNSSKSFVSGQKGIRGVSQTGYQQTILEIPSGAVYARFTLEVSANFPQTDFKVYAAVVESDLEPFN